MDNVKVHWVSTREEGKDEDKFASDELTAETAQGMIEWVAEMEPGASLDLNLAWEIVSPAGMEWSFTGIIGLPCHFLYYYASLHLCA